MSNKVSGVIDYRLRDKTIQYKSESYLWIDNLTSKEFMCSIQIKRNKKFPISVLYKIP